MKGRFFTSRKTRIRRLHGDSLQRRVGVFLVAAQTFPGGAGRRKIDVWTGRLSVLFAFNLKPSTIDANGDAGVPPGLYDGRSNPYPGIWKLVRVALVLSD
jgi:hypothetical protein